MQINRHNSPLFAHGLAKWGTFVAGYSGPYDFSQSVYAGMNRKVSYECPEHGTVQSDAKVLMSGGRCKLCEFSSRGGRLRFTQKKMLAMFAKAHGDRYDYVQAEYLGQRTPVSIFCREHGAFLQRPEYHWAGSGCPQCFHVDRRGASSRDTLDTFVVKLKGVFGDLIDCSEGLYLGSQQDILARCVKHNRVLRTKPNWLLGGCNPCPQCNHTKSKGEDSVAEYLSTFTAVVRRDRNLLKPKELDIYMPAKVLAVEFCGAFWHSHFDAASERQDKRKHVDKYEACKAQGIRLLTIYDAEWQEHAPALRRLLRNAVGKSKGRLMARKCTLQRVPTSQANAFFDRYHPQGGAGSGENYGLYWNAKLVACMRFALGQNDRGAGAAARTWTLGRYATRVTVAGAASRLFKAFLKDFKPTEVKSFSDNRYFSGGMYEQLGFALDASVPPDYQVWSPKLGLRPKAHYQRRLLQKRLDEHGVEDTFSAAADPRTEAEMTYLMGCGRIYDCGKKRWVWTES